MKRTMRTVLLVLLLAVFPASVFADDAGSVTYDGENLVSDYNAIDVSDLQPGDSQTYTIKVQNDGDEETDWWLSNEVVQSLEDSTEASGGAYTYILQYNGEDIYNNDTVGGEDTTGGEGLHKATNAMEEFFFLGTLAAGDSGEVTLTVALDGESQGNSYQDAAGQICCKTTSVCQRNPVLCTFKQLHIQYVFQFLHRSAQSRLRDVQMICSCR